MSPSSLHETILNSLIGVLHGKYINQLGHDDLAHEIVTCMNGSLLYDPPGDTKGSKKKTGSGSKRETIPDFQLAIKVNAGENPGKIMKWIGEVAFTVPTSKTRDRLKDVVASYPSVDLAFLFSIDESPKWESPANDNPFAQQLRAQPFVEYRDFKPAAGGDGMTITFGGITWASVSRVALEVYVRSPEEAILVIDGDDQSEYTARGVRFALCIIYFCSCDYSYFTLLWRRKMSIIYSSMPRKH